jgi:hypothetical protein
VINKQDYRPGFDCGRGKIQQEELERVQAELENNEVSRPFAPEALSAETIDRSTIDALS